jgi:hypothetical protein
MTNEIQGGKVVVACSCKGRNSNCVMCDGTGKRFRKACRRCGGSGKEGPTATCLDCRGDGYREVDDL